MIRNAVESDYSWSTVLEQYGHLYRKSFIRYIDATVDAALSSKDPEFVKARIQRLKNYGERHASVQKNEVKLALANLAKYLIQLDCFNFQSQMQTVKVVRLVLHLV